MTGAIATTVAKATPVDRALFATTARLISCLVTESVVRALYYTLDGFEASGFAVVLCNATAPIDVNYGSNDILCVIPLQHVPVFKHDGTDPRGSEIGLLDPLDMLPLVFEPVEVTGALNTTEVRVLALGDDGIANMNSRTMICVPPLLKPSLPLAGLFHSLSNS